MVRSDRRLCLLAACQGWNVTDCSNAGAKGEGGYPIVDAGMRQLNQTGWMPNRVRMITASFLIKDLRIDWQSGERYFMNHLLDADVAANNGNWQWCASTGTDAMRGYRIFNPALQSKKFDPDGRYIREYVPELAQVMGRHIHEPHLMTDEQQVRAGAGSVSSISSRSWITSRPAKTTSCWEKLRP